MGLKMAIASQQERDNSLELARLFEETVDHRFWHGPEIDGEGYKIEHNAALKLVKKYANDLGDIGGSSGFEIRKFKTAGRPGEEAGEKSINRMMLALRDMTF